jgi:protein gp37
MPTKIEWCDEVFNPITGCSSISEEGKILNEGFRRVI